jgi:hypothetical protein
MQLELRNEDERRLVMEALASFRDDALSAAAVCSDNRSWRFDVQEAKRHAERASMADDLRTRARLA